MLAIDGRTPFVTGLCIGDMWIGDPAKGLEPGAIPGWAGGPAVSDVEASFAESWAMCGTPLPDEDRVTRGALAPAGHTASG